MAAVRLIVREEVRAVLAETGGVPPTAPDQRPWRVVIDGTLRFGFDTRAAAAGYADAVARGASGQVVVARDAAGPVSWTVRREDRTTVYRIEPAPEGA